MVAKFIPAELINKNMSEIVIYMEIYNIDFVSHFPDETGSANSPVSSSTCSGRWKRTAVDKCGRFYLTNSVMSKY